MTTLEELISYLEIKNPAGAVMVTGEWGCGKTYLIEHDLRDAVSAKFIIIKISLFGMTAIGDIHNEVKLRWFDAFLKSREFDKIADKAKPAIDFASRLPIPDVVKDVLSIDPLDYVKIKNVIDDKTVVLVFDDLERCRMSIVDILGCINSYCENQGFKTIIVANEARIHDEKTGEASSDDLREENTQLLYKEIKEKIVQRTLHYKPDYANIISSVLDEYEDNNPEYKEFIVGNKTRISGLFVNSYDFFLNNIRCLKCAVQDFSRIFTMLSAYEIKDIEKWIGPFFLFEAAVRNGIFRNEKDPLTELAKNEDFDAVHFIRGVDDWIVKGTWDNDRIRKETEYIRLVQNLDNDYDKLRLGAIESLEDSVIANGFDPLIKNAYAGNLDPDDYLTLIKNIVWARVIGYSFKSEISLEKLSSGLDECFQRIREKKIRDDSRISCESVLQLGEHLLEQDEVDILNRISAFRESDCQRDIDEEARYIAALSEGISYYREHYKEFENKIMTGAMVDKIYEVYAGCSNAEKNGFSKIIGYHANHLQKSEENVKSLNRFKLMLTGLESAYKSQGKQIAYIHTKELLQTIDLMISEMSGQK